MTCPACAAELLGTEADKTTGRVVQWSCPACGRQFKSAEQRGASREEKWKRRLDSENDGHIDDDVIEWAHAIREYKQRRANHAGD